jgi:hypothetical protein
VPLHANVYNAFSERWEEIFVRGERFCESSEELMSSMMREGLGTSSFVPSREK